MDETRTRSDASGAAVGPVSTGTEAVIADCGVYVDGRRLPGRLPLLQAGDVARATDGFVWVGLQQPTTTDIDEVAQEFGLPALAVEDAVKAHQRPKLEVYGDVVFLVLKPVRYIDSAEVVDISEIAVFLGPHFVVTVRHGNSGVLRQVRQELDSHADGDDDTVPGSGPSAVLYRAADLIVDGYEQVIENINVDVDEIEAQVFGPGGDDHAERIYKLKQEVADFRRAVLPLARPLESLMAGEVRHVPPELGAYFRDVHDHLMRAADAVEGIDRQLTDVLQANTARVTTAQSRVALRQNEDMRRISAWAAIALVPTAIAGVYGMNFDNMPELRWQYGYFAVLGVIAGACLLLHWLFRRNGWL